MRIYIFLILISIHSSIILSFGLRVVSISDFIFIFLALKRQRKAFNAASTQYMECKQECRERTQKSMYLLVHKRNVMSTQERIVYYTQTYRHKLKYNYNKKKANNKLLSLSKSCVITVFPQSYLYQNKFVHF